jgi:hypothetical protein
MTQVRRPLIAAALAVAAVLGTAGCDRAISGTPVAAAGAALLSTRCSEYVSMPEAGRREVIAAIGADGNKLVDSNPELWVGLAAALCTFTDPETPVLDVVAGGLR